MSPSPLQRSFCVKKTELKKLVCNLSGIAATAGLYKGGTIEMYTDWGYADYLISGELIMIPTS